MDLPDLLAEKGIDHRMGDHHHCRPGWIQLDCPFCGKGSGKFHLGYNLGGRYFHCWKCRGHSLWKVMEALGFRDVKQVVEGLKGGARYVPATTRKTGKLKEPSGVKPMLRVHRDYLRGRGFDPKQVEKIWKVQGLGLVPELAWRLYLPVEEDGRTVSWTTRSLSNQGQRYISAPLEKSDVPIKDTVYGRDFCHHSIVVVEGALDAWRVGPGAGALHGTAFTPRQVLLLSKYPLRVICFDADAQQFARSLADQLSCFPGKTMVVELDAKDPGEASDREIKLLRKCAKL